MATEIIICPTGDARAIYSDEFDFACMGAVEIRRASHCEPDDSGNWWADLSPVNGPRLGPFEKRSAALQAEVEWLRTNILS